MSEQIRGLIREVGRAAVHTMFPNDVEYYAITIELVDSTGLTEEFLTFPVNPETFSYDDRSLVMIKKTMGGVTTMNSDTFVPKPINFSGTFGRSFKLLISPEIQRNRDVGVDLSSENGLSISTGSFAASLKSGYGALKLLEKILIRSKQLDSKNNPYRLFIYLPLVGHNFVVEYNNFMLKQDFSTSNMMWRYDCQLTAISPLVDNTTGGDRAVRAITNNVIQSSANSILRRVKRLF